MNREERNIIDRYNPQLVDDIIPVDMLPYLPCLAPCDKEKIKCEETNYGARRATMELLSRLRRRHDSFPEFIFALRATGCGHLAELLDPQEQGMWKDC